ncbi:MAG: hypothetical protein ACRCWU_00960 [Metamycoplasmataceae bacterium]
MLENTWLTFFIGISISTFIAGTIVFKRKKSFEKIEEENKIGFFEERNLEIWEANKKMYLKLMIILSILKIISIALLIPIIILANREYGIVLDTPVDTFISPKFILIYIYLFIFLIKTWLYIQIRKICSKFFFNKNFVEDVNLKKFNWFFKTPTHIGFFIAFHALLLGIIFAIIIYKDINKNNKNQIQTLI